ncbi:MAG: hypothetical protein J07HB67_00673 [halophilic archaeon J07HB67]|jgi:hypothetical protein|nr:MAG: hypothetical protein J07HB67_00673 [halophilic archaeon J07HB67]
MEGRTTGDTDDGRPTWYVVGGTLAAIVSLLLFVPVAGLVAIYCGVRIHAAGERVFAYVLGVGGGIPVLLWLAGTVG